MAALSTDDAAPASMNMNQEEEEESCWVPLVPAEEETPESSQPRAQVTPPNSSPPPPRRNTSNGRHPPQRESLQVISARLDSRIRLKKGLVDHPLDQTWRLFLQHLSREIWQLEIPLQLGVVLVVIGMILQMITWTLSFQWIHPQTIILLAVFGVSFYYLAPPDVERKIRAFFRLLVNPGKAFELADYADPEIMRRLFVVLLLLPTFLEMRTFGFLSEAMAESGFRSNASVGLLLGAFLAFRFKIQRATPRQCIQQGILVLYGFALFFSLWRVDLWRLPGLAGPFFLATGTLLLSSRDEDMNWLSRALRHALRLTLRDVLASVGESVREDEMLQLAMLRWIVDFWSNQPSQPPPPSPASSPGVPSPTQPGSTASRPTTDIVPARQPRPEPQPQDAQQQRGDLQWEELQSMLDMTTDQMTEEVPAHQAGSFSEQSSASRPSQSSTGGSSRQDNDSLRNLRNMLHALDVDDRARPAVMKYKHVVESFPPQRNHAVFLSIIRRCPAMLMLLYRYVSGSDLALASTATLLPFAIMEAFRVLHWAEACQRALESGVRTPLSEQVADSRSRSSLISLPPDMDPMCILLSGDWYTPAFPPPLLQVWINICSSVQALETGLTAARCVQTTAVAADFASNIISLAHFGFEVTQYGWIHGVTVLATEIMHIHATQSASEAKYTSAAFHAVRNGSIVARNVKALSEEEGGNPVIDPIVGVLTAIVGRGWLWGKEEERRYESTVTIEELPADEITSDDRKEFKALTKEAAVEPKEDDRDEHQEESVDGTSESSAEDSRGKNKPTVETSSEPSTEEVPEAGEGTTANAVAPLPEDESRTDEEKPPPTDPALPSSELATGVCESEHDLSELMQLIADAFEQGLIVESEKNAFMETLLVSGTEAKQKPSQATVEQMERSLRELLESSGNDATSCHQQQESSPPVLFPEEGDAGEQADSSSSALEHADDSDEWRPLNAQPEEDTQRMAIADEARTADQGTRSVASARSAAPPESNENSIATPDLHATSVTSATVQRSTQQEQGNGDEWVKWLGGSLAVIGAVAGGVAIANTASRREDDSSSRQNNTASQSTVYIEELDGDTDENADEWVAVSQDEND